MAAFAERTFPFPFLRCFARLQESWEGAQMVYLVSSEPKAAMPLRVRRRGGVSIATPMFPPLDGQAQRLVPGDEKRFLDDAVRYLGDHRLCDRVNQPANWAVFQAVPEGALSAPFGSYCLDLGGVSTERLFEGIHGKHRNVIRKAERSGVCVKYGSDQVEAFHRLYVETWARSERGCEPLSYFRMLLDLMGEEQAACGVAYFGDEPVGAHVVLWSLYGAYYVYGASAPDPGVSGAVNFLHWTTIQRMKAAGVARYDFVGSRLSDVSGTRLEGIQRFKARFGGRLERGYLWKIDLNRSKCRVYDALRAARQTLRRARKSEDIIDEERRKLALRPGDRPDYQVVGTGAP